MFKQPIRLENVKIIIVIIKYLIFFYKLLNICQRFERWCGLYKFYFICY